MRMSALVGLVALLATLLAAPPASATFPGANGKIAFDVYNRFLQSQIAVIEPDGSGRTNLTSTAHRSNYDSAWSADGSQIAFVTRSLLGITSYPKLRMMNADGSGQTLVVSLGSPWDMVSPSWSPDGTEIVFCAFNENLVQDKIFTVTTDGSATLTKLSHKGDNECDPDWSPDGTTIVFNSSSSGSEEIWTMGTDGSSRTDIGPGFSPSWSPDGTQIVFTKPAPKRTDVFVMNADGSGTTRITHTRKRWEYGPVFSPDGTDIAFSRTIGRHSYDTHDIWTITLSGGSLTRLTDTPKKDELGANWQPILP